MIFFLFIFLVESSYSSSHFLQCIVEISYLVALSVAVVKCLKKSVYPPINLIQTVLHISHSAYSLPPHVLRSVYLSVQRLIDVHSVVLALFDEHVSTFPHESCRRVGVDRAAQEHRLLLVVTATHIADGLVNRQHRCVEI